jgi:murein DD-endopeptidase MepM/ murein hydrolase activator NlpD
MKYHTGTDFAVAEGTPVIAPMPGVVALVQDTVLGGKTVLLHHGAGLLTSYLHLSEITVEPGQWIDQGHVIGKSGRSGRATGPHLHWEGFWYGERFNAASLLTFAKLPSKIYRPLPTTAQLTLRGSLGTVKNVK